MIRVAIVAASLLVRSGLRRAIEAQARFVAAAAAESIARLQLGLDPDSPTAIDVVIVDWEAGADPAPLWAVLDSSHRLVILADDEPVALIALVAAGAAWLPRAAADAEIAAAIDAVAAGLVALRSESIGDLLRQPPGTRAQREAELIEPLTPREREVLNLLADGLANKAIAQALGISAHTAKFHVAHILDKLDAATRAEAVAIGVREGLINA
jgi:DNA-binding NarL/FixJ family response regulator